MSYAEITKLTGKSFSTVRKIIIRFKDRKTVVQKAGCGRKLGIEDKRTEKRVLTLFEKKPDLGKLGISWSLVQKIKKKNGLVTYKA